MIATHNIKVNGRWILAGESYEEPAGTQMEIPVAAEPEPVAEEAPEAEKEPAKEPARPKTARRKASK